VIPQNKSMGGKTMRLILFQNEYMDKQKEKHEAYTKDGFKLTVQRLNGDRTIVREYTKTLGRKK